MTAETLRREREAILHDLASADDELRRLAVERLLSLPASESLPHLLERLGDTSWRVRKAAVDRLVALSERHPVEDRVIEALADGENSGRRNSAFEALVLIGRRVTARLLQALQSDDVDVRKLVVDVLGAIGDPECSDAMIRMLDDPDANVRGAAADALGMLGDDYAASALVAAAARDDEDQLVRLSALRALARIEHPMGIADLGSIIEDPVLRPAAHTLLGLCGDDESVEVLLKGVGLASRASREAAIAALLRVLARADGAAADALVVRIAETARATDRSITASIERLPDADLATRIVLIQFLGLTRDARSAVPILEAGNDEAITEIAHATLASLGDVAVEAFAAGWSEIPPISRAAACSLMARCQGDAARQLLLTSLDDTDSELRAAAARALGAMECVDALPALVRRLERVALDDDPEIEEERFAIVDALVALAPPADGEASPHAREVVAALADRLDGAVEDVRLAIATVLGRVGRVEDEALVARLLKDPSARVRRAAVEALARLEPDGASEPLRLALADEAPTVRIAAAVALGRSQNPAVVDDLRRLLQDEDPRVSAAAVRSIGAHCQRDHVADALALELIAEALTADGMVALAGIEALCLMGGSEAGRAAIPALRRSEPELVQAAVVCIGAHGDGETVAELISLVSHDSWSVRAEAIQNLAERRVGRAVPSILRRLETEQDAFVRDAILRALRQLED